MNADAAAYKKSSFGPAFLFLDKNRREALAVYYAFCRLADDIADEPGVQDRLGEIARWKEEIRRVFAGNPATKLGIKLKEISARYAIKEDRFLLLLEGMEADINSRSYKTLEDLQWYLWRVAGVVGLATLDILGVKGPQAEHLARALGFAVQTTNIVRDVYEDASLGRVYLPEDMLSSRSLTRADVLGGARREELSFVLADLAQISKQYYCRAGDILRTFPARKILPCRVMGFVYRANLAKIEKKGFAFAHPVKLSKFEKALQCIYALYKTDFAD